MVNRRSCRKKRERNPIIFLGVEGVNNKTEKQYFSHFRSRNVGIKICDYGRTDVRGMANELIRFMSNNDFGANGKDRAYLLVDSDMKRDKICRIRECSAYCEKNNISIIMSNPEIEVWFAFHYTKYGIPVDKKDLYFFLSEKIGKKYSKNTDIFSYINDNLKDAIVNAKDAGRFNSRTGGGVSSDVFKIIEYMINSGLLML